MQGTVHRSACMAACMKSQFRMLYIVSNTSAKQQSRTTQCVHTTPSKLRAINPPCASTAHANPAAYTLSSVLFIVHQTMFFLSSDSWLILAMGW